MSDFRIKTYVLGGVSTNCYLVFRESEKTAVIIDPADNADYLKNKCREFGVRQSFLLMRILIICWLRMIFAKLTDARFMSIWTMSGC